MAFQLRLQIYEDMMKMLTRTILFSFCLSLSTSLFAQESESDLKLEGWVIDQKDNRRIPDVHVINKSTLKGGLTDAKGAFQIDIEFGDTIVFSNIKYQYFYFIYSDTDAVLNDVLVEMEEQNYLLNEVSIFSHKLTTNDPKEIKLEEPLYPSSEDISDGRIVQASLQNPAEYLYNLFGSKPRQLRKLAQLKAEDAYRKKLEESNNRENVVTLTGLSKEELEAFMFYCKFTTVRMNDLNDYQFLKSVQYCYSQYVKERELENFLQQFD